MPGTSGPGTKSKRCRLRVPVHAYLTNANAAVPPQFAELPERGTGFSVCALLVVTPGVHHVGPLSAYSECAHLSHRSD